MSLFDTGSDENFISESILVYVGNPKKVQVKERVFNLADGSKTMVTNKVYYVDLEYKHRIYRNLRFLIYKNKQNDLSCTMK